MSPSIKIKFNKIKFIQCIYSVYILKKVVQYFSLNKHLKIAFENLKKLPFNDMQKK